MVLSILLACSGLCAQLYWGLLSMLWTCSCKSRSAATCIPPSIYGLIPLNQHYYSKGNPQLASKRFHACVHLAQRTGVTLHVAFRELTQRSVRTYCADSPTDGPLAVADTLVDVLTVEEMLMYTAELKRSVKEAKSSKKAAVDGLIDDLGLEACRNVRIGNSMNRGISGGQVRTVSRSWDDGPALMSSCAIL